MLPHLSQDPWLFGNFGTSRHGPLPTRPLELSPYNLKDFCSFAYRPALPQGLAQAQYLWRFPHRTMYAPDPEEHWCFPSRSDSTKLENHCVLKACSPCKLNAECRGPEGRGSGAMTSTLQDHSFFKKRLGVLPKRSIHSTPLGFRRFSYSGPTLGLQPTGYRTILAFTRGLLRSHPFLPTGALVVYPKGP